VTEATGLLVVVGFLAAAVGSVPLAVLAVVLARHRSFAGALIRALAATAVVVAVLAVAVATVTPAAGATLGLVLWVVPLVVARRLLARTAGDPDRALRNATLGLPVSMAVAVALAFGDFGRYNVTFSTGPEAVLRWSALAVVVLLGPTAAGALVGATVGTRA
jgi:hypothetical protein